MSKVTFTVNQPYGSPTGIAIGVSGGTWNPKTISMRVVAWQSVAETDVDLAGFPRGSVALYNNKSVGLNGTVSVTFTPPTKPYNHLAFYYQEASSWNNANPCKKCTIEITESTGTSYIILVKADDDTATITFGAANYVEINPVIHFSGSTRENVVRAYNGKWITKSYAFNALSDVIEISGAMGSCTSTAYDYILKWIKYGIPLTCVDSSVGSYSPYITTYTGKLVSTDYFKSPGKNVNSEFKLIFGTDSEV